MNYETQRANKREQMKMFELLALLNQFGDMLKDDDYKAIKHDTTHPQYAIAQAYAELWTLVSRRYASFNNEHKRHTWD